MLELDDVHVFYGGVHALKGVSLKVPDGSVVTLIGANGAGKTTTLRTICGLERPQRGAIRFDGDDIKGLRPFDIVAAGIAMVPEGRRIFTNLTVRENLMMGAYARQDEAGTQEVLHRVFELFPRLKDRLQQSGGTLSGGEQQMLAVGRALMSRPSLLLMDEPSLGLAPKLVDELVDRIERIHSEGTSVLLVEQNARAALRVATYGYVLEVGQVVLQAPAAELAQDQRVQDAYIGGASAEQVHIQ